MKFAKLSVVALLLVLCLCVFAACGGGKDTESDTTTESDPTVTDPVGTEPDETKETDPDDTDPAVTDPKDTDPVDTDPKDTDPKDTDPVEPQPVTPEHQCTGETVTVAATCKAEGSTKVVCSICGKVLESKTLPKLNHTFREGATCESDSVCTVCGETIKATGTCEFDTRQVLKEATCTEKGLAILTCSKCGNTVGIQPPALGHEYTSAYANDAYATEGGDRPTCELEGKLTYTCVRGDHSYTEPVPTVPHEFEEGTVTYTAPSLLTDGSYVGTCIWCEDDAATNVIDAIALENFEDIAEGTLVKNSDGKYTFPGFGTDFTVGPLTGGTFSYTVVAEDDGNQYWLATLNQPTAGTNIVDQTGKLAYETFEISLRVKFNSLSDSGRIVSLKGSAETALLSYLNGKLVFGTNNDSHSVELASGTTIYKDGEYQWVDVKVVVDPVTVNYTIYINDELTLRTETSNGSHKIYKVSGTTETEVSKNITDKSPFAVSGKIDRLYMFHFASLTIAIDDFSVKIPEIHTCNETLKTVSSTCTTQGYTVNYCSICGAEDEDSKTMLPLLDHNYNLEAATCTENKKCTSCGLIVEKAAGHKGDNIVTTPASFCVNGSITGTCTVCGEVNEVIPAGITETFDNMAVGSITADILADKDKSAFAAVFNPYVSNNNYSAFEIKEENGNKFLKRIAGGNGFFVEDTTGLLNTNKFEISVDIRAEAAGSNTGVLSLNVHTNDDGTSDEMRIVALQGNDLVFGSLDGTYKIVRNAYKEGGSAWINLRVIVDPATYNYEIYADGEKVLYTETVAGNKHKINWLDGVEWKSGQVSDTYHHRSPFSNEDGVIKGVYMFHFSDVNVSVDNLRISILDMEHSYEQKSVAATCKTPSKTWEECKYCGDIINEYEGDSDETAHVPGEPTNNTATCLAGGTAEIRCTVDGCGVLIDTITTEKLEHAFSKWTVTTAPTLCTAGSKTRTCTGNNTAECTEVETEVIPASLYETFESYTVGSKPTFSALANSFTASVTDGIAVKENADGKYLNKPASSTTIKLTDSADFLSSNNFKISFDFSAETVKGGGIIGLNDRSMTAKTSGGTTIYNGDPHDEMRILSTNASDGGVYFWNFNSHADTTGTNHTFYLYNAKDGATRHIEIEVYPTLDANGLLTCIDYKVYIDGNLMVETSGTGKTEITSDSPYAFPIKTIKWRSINSDGTLSEYKEKTFAMPAPDSNSTGVQCPFYTIRAIDERGLTQIQKIYFFHSNTGSYNVDNLSVSFVTPAHQYETTVTQAATCQLPELSKTVCKLCGDGEDSEPTQTAPADPNKHTEVPTVRAATCTAEGAIVSVCSGCKKDIKTLVTLPKLAHNIETVTESTSATLTTEGSETGTCTVCQETVTNVIPKQAIETFEDATGTSDAFASLSDNFTVSYGKSSVVSIAAEGENNVLVSTGSAAMVLSDTNGLLNTHKFELSFDMKHNDGANNSAVVSFNTRGAGNKNEMRVLSVYNSLLAFGAGTHDFVETTKNTEWKNVRIVFDPSTYDYVIYIDDVVVLFTVTDTSSDGHMVYYLGEEGYEISTKNYTEDPSPFTNVNGKIESIYFYHYFHTTCTEQRLDNVKITLLEELPASAE